MNYQNSITKKIIIFLFIFFIMAGLFIFINFSSDQKVNNTKKEIPVYKNTNCIDFIEEKKQSELKNEIKNYIYSELEYTKNEVDEITFLETAYSENDKIYFFFVLNDGLDTIYGTYFDTKKNSISYNFIWYGDKNNLNYRDSSVPYSYYEIADKDEFSNEQYQKEIENKLPDNDDGDYEYY